MSTVYDVIKRPIITEKGLALKVRRLHKIPIDQPHKAYASTNELVGRHRTESTQT